MRRQLLRTYRGPDLGNKLQGTRLQHTKLFAYGTPNDDDTLKISTLSLAIGPRTNKHVKKYPRLVLTGRKRYCQDEVVERASAPLRRGCRLRELSDSGEVVQT